MIYLRIYSNDLNKLIFEIFFLFASVSTDCAAARDPLKILNGSLKPHFRNTDVNASIASPEPILSTILSA